MSDTKHTPGPWRVGAHSGAVIRDCPDRDACEDCTPAQTAFYGGHVICESAREQDRPILAAAPDLLAALEAAPKPIRSNHGVTYWSDYAGWYDGPRAAALAKARGKP